jgi:hypothetical protein
MSPSRLGEDEIPMTVWRVVFCFRFKTLIESMGLLLGACLIFPCLVPLVLWFIKTIIKAVIKTNKQTKNGHTCNDAIKIQTPRSR